MSVRQHAFEMFIVAAGTRYMFAVAVNRSRLAIEISKGDKEKKITHTRQPRQRWQVDAELNFAGEQYCTGQRGG